MIWTALVPLKPAAARKGRLAARLGPDARARLSLRLLGRLGDALDAVPAIGAAHLLAEAPAEGWRGGWLADQGRGLNAEVEAARLELGAVPLLVIHADLPLISAEDVASLLARAETAGAAVAPDRHGEGTNAVALTPGHPFAFAFGPGSFARHRPQAGAVVERTGLALDCDTPDDLDRAIAGGFPIDGLE